MSTTAPDFSTILVSIDEPHLSADGEPAPGTLGRLTLNQPERMNPIGLTPLRELAQAAAWFDANDVSVVIVTGAGDRSFCAGFDLNEFAGSDDEGNGADLGRRMAEALENMDATLVAAIHGHCIGGGLVLAAACDLRIAADNTRFSIPEVDLGIPLAWGGIPRLVREIGPAMTRELVLTCRPFDAEDGLRLGFLNRVVPRADLDAEVESFARTLCDKAPILLRTTKRQVQNAIEDMASTRDGWSGVSHLAAAMADQGAADAARRYLRSRGK